MANLRLHIKSVTILANAPQNSDARAVNVNYAVDALAPELSYRVLLPREGNSGSVTVQGWVEIQNQSKHDLVDADVTIVSGPPTSLEYDPYWGWNGEPQDYIENMDNFAEVE